MDAWIFPNKVRGLTAGVITEMNTLQIEGQAERARAYLDQAAARAPILDGRAHDTEAAGQILPGTMADLRAGGFTRLCQPRKFDGGELPLDDAARVIAALAAGCGRYQVSPDFMETPNIDP